jgi:hypothetical protein
MTVTSRTHVAHSSTGLRLPVPSGWEALVDAGVPVVLTHAIEPGQAPRFRPSMVATVEQPPDALTDIAAYTDSSLGTMRRMLTGFHVIAADAITISGHEGRRVLAGYRGGIYALAAEYWWTVVHGVATTLTANCQVEDYLDLEPVFEEVAAGLVPAAQVPVTGAAR